MSYLVAQVKEHLLTNGESIQPQDVQLVAIAPANNLANNLADDLEPHPSELCLDCSIQATKGTDSEGLLARVTYRFPGRIPASLEDVFRYVEALNQQLINSQVFVVQDLDGDRGYYLRMDTFAKGTVERQLIANCLDDVTEDAAILLAYFNHPCANSASTQPANAHSHQSESHQSQETLSQKTLCLASAT